MPEHEKTHPTGNRVGLESDQLNLNDTNLDQLVDDHRQLVGSIICASAGVRDRLFRTLAPGDLDTPVAADALEILRALHADGVTDRADLCEQFADRVADRRRNHCPGDRLKAQYPGGPKVWLATAFRDAIPLGEHGAMVLALQYSGTGHRRAVAHAADVLARAARDPQMDQDDVDAAAEHLLPLITPVVTG